MSDWSGWFMLAAAVFLVVVNRLRPQGRNATRGSLALAGFMASMAFLRLAEPEGAPRSALLAVQLILAAAAVWFMLRSFRSGELKGTGKGP